MMQSITVSDDANISHEATIIDTVAALAVAAASKPHIFEVRNLAGVAWALAAVAACHGIGPTLQSLATAVTERVEHERVMVAVSDEHHRALAGTIWALAKVFVLPRHRCHMRFTDHFIVHSMEMTSQSLANTVWAGRHYTLQAKSMGRLPRNRGGR